MMGMNISKESNQIKIREAFLESSNIDESSKKDLSDIECSDLIVIALKAHVGMKQNYASEMKKIMKENEMLKRVIETEKENGEKKLTFIKV